ncbi:aminotransferase class III-fold pyridoxal phosphate-dependent enzyme [Streptomyces sp. I05A-00742]|uniref:aminotransferase class III-fold pyridoxal phosphate-dependent enzyme n=1 Tax=Streptomyces sp. I05A-00742 TaxID=2732853 RepID=UPI001488C0EF|nr:aminotransferase class III-fold pyridoxal phosphate-dependent enzyme [Streptomyces sp. I05A-00742]
MALTQPSAVLSRDGTRRPPPARAHACPLPIVPVRARGLTVDGADGRRYLDCFPGAGTLVLGHHHPVVREAVRSALARGVPPAEVFADELRATLPGRLAHRARFRFCAPTRTAALAAARDLVGGAGDLFEVARDFEAADGEEWTRDRAAARSVPLIADETRTGLGRTGTFWAVERSGVVPDALVLGGAVGGGLPLALVVHGDDAPGTAVPPGGVRGNRLAMAAGAATLRYVRENGLAARAGALGARMLARLRRAVRDCAGITGVHGRGLLLGVGCADAAVADAVRRACLRRGLLVGGDGGRPGLVRLLPPLTLTDEQAEAVLDRFTDAVAEVSRRGPRLAAGPWPATVPRIAAAPRKPVSTRKEAGAAPA